MTLVLQSLTAGYVYATAIYIPIAIGSTTIGLCYKSQLTLWILILVLHVVLLVYIVMVYQTKESLCVGSDTPPKGLSVLPICIFDKLEEVYLCYQCIVLGELCISLGLMTRNYQLLVLVVDTSLELQ